MPIYQHATGGVQRLEYGNGVALLGKVRGAGETGRTGAHHGDLYAVGRGLLWHGVHMLPVPVRHKPLQAANGHGFALDAPNALAFALALLGADPAADGGQAVGGGDDAEGLIKLALRHLGNKIRDMYIHRAAGDTLRVLAVQAALCLIDGNLRSIAQGHLVKVLVPDVRLLEGMGFFFKDMFAILFGLLFQQIAGLLVHVLFEGLIHLIALDPPDPSPPCVRQNPGRLHRQTSSRRPHSAGSRRTSRCRRS